MSTFCQSLEKYFKIVDESTIINDIQKFKIKSECLKHFPDNLFIDFHNHFNTYTDHFMSLINNVCDLYINIRLKNIIKSQNQKHNSFH